MKISSASKKVLASALSAAMVVAFAPTVAFGATPGQLVNVKYDISGLTAADGTSAPADETVQLDDTDNLEATLTNVPGSGAYTFADGSAVAGWYFDANGNGVKDSEDIAVVNGKLTLEADTDLTDGTTVTLKPYKAAWDGATVAAATDPVQPGETTGVIATVTPSTAGAYKAVLKKGDAELASMTLSSTNDNFQLVESYDSTHKKDAGYVLASEYGTGSYTLTVTNLANDKQSVTEAFEIIGVTFQGIYGSAGSYTVNKAAYLYKGKKVSETTAVASEVGTPTGWSDTSADQKAITGYTVNGKVVTNDTMLADGDVLAAIYSDTVIATASYKNGAIVLNGANLDGKRAVINGKETALTNAADQAVYSFGDAGAASGKYTVEVYKDTTSGSSTVSKKVATAEIELAKVSFDANGGKFASKQAAKTAVVGEKVSGYTSGVTAPTRNGYTFAGWSTDGATVLKSNAKIAGDTELKAVWTQATSEKPAYTWADGTLTVTAPADYDAYVQIDSGSEAKYTGPVALKASPSTVKTVVISLKKTTGTLTPASVTIKSSANQAISTELTNSLVAETSTSTKTAPKYYSKEVKAAVDAAAAAIKAQGYATDKEWSALILKQEAAVLKAVADYETANLDAAVAGLAQADGSVIKISDTAAAEAKKSIETVLADFDAVYDNDDKTVASKSYSDKSKFVPEIAKAAKKAIDTATTYAKADVDAAAAVTKALKEAKTGAEAKAAVEAYNKLTSTQKELVASADVAAAQEIVTKAEADEAAKALIEAQDEAAVAKVAGKTVKAKAKKTVKSSLKVVTSKSGAKSTFKKVTKNSKVTVSSTGKITVKKGLKAGKTYKVKVKATVGAQTKTVTVTVKVAK